MYLYSLLPLLVLDLFQFLKDIAGSGGTGSQQVRVDIIRKMLVRAVDAEPMFIIRHCQGKLRIGMSDKTLLVAVAQAFAMTPIGPDGLGHDIEFKTSEQKDAAFEKSVYTLKHVFSELPDWGMILPALRRGQGNWVETLPKECHLTPGIPIHPMLAKPTKGVTEVLDRFDGKDFTCEFKYDGERAQVKDGRHQRDDANLSYPPACSSL